MVYLAQENYNAKIPLNFDDIVVDNITQALYIHFHYLFIPAVLCCKLALFKLIWSLTECSTGFFEKTEKPENQPAESKGVNIQANWKGLEDPAGVFWHISDIWQFHRLSEQTQVSHWETQSTGSVTSVSYIYNYD